MKIWKAKARADKANTLKTEVSTSCPNWASIFGIAILPIQTELYSLEFIQVIHFLNYYTTGYIAKAAALGVFKTPHEQFSTILDRYAGSTPIPDKVISKARDVVTSSGSWSTSGPLSHGYSQQNMPRQSFPEHSVHMGESSHIWDRSIRMRNVSTIRVLRISQLRNFPRSVTPWTILKIPRLTAALETALFQSFSKIHDDRWGSEQIPI